MFTCIEITDFDLLTGVSVNLDEGKDLNHQSKDNSAGNYSLLLFMQVMLCYS